MTLTLSISLNVTIYTAITSTITIIEKMSGVHVKQNWNIQLFGGWGGGGARQPNVLTVTTQAKTYKTKIWNTYACEQADFNIFISNKNAISFKFCWYCMTLFYLYWHNSKCTKKTLKKHRGLKEGYCPTLFGYATDKEYRIFIVYSIPYITWSRPDILKADG